MYIGYYSALSHYELTEQVPVNESVAQPDDSHLVRDIVVPEAFDEFLDRHLMVECGLRALNDDVVATGDLTRTHNYRHVRTRGKKEDANGSLGPEGPCRSSISARTVERTSRQSPGWSASSPGVGASGPGWTCSREL